MREEPDGFEAFWCEWRKTKRPDGRKRLGEVQVFYREVVLPYASDECLPWPYARNGGGYGQIAVNGKMKDVHRIICTATHGPAPSAIHEAAHSCGNKICANRGHLSWKTPLQNASDKYLHGTVMRGEANGTAKLTTVQALEIRSLRRVIPIKDVAGTYGISVAQVSRIQNGTRWSAA